VIRDAIDVRAGRSALTAVGADRMLKAASLIEWCTDAAREAAAPGV
jgi:hypothetical protein